MMSFQVLCHAKCFLISYLSEGVFLFTAKALVYTVVVVVVNYVI